MIRSAYIALLVRLIANLISFSNQIRTFRLSEDGGKPTEVNGVKLRERLKVLTAEE